MPLRSSYRRARALFSAAFRPAPDVVETFARLIADREGCSVEACREQAELQLWACGPKLPRPRHEREREHLADDMLVAE